MWSCITRTKLTFKRALNTAFVMEMEKLCLFFSQNPKQPPPPSSHWRLILSSVRVHQRVVCTVNKVQTVTIFLRNKGPDEQFVTYVAAAGLKNKEEDRNFIWRRLDVKALWAYGFIALPHKKKLEWGCSLNETIMILELDYSSMKPILIVGVQNNIA